MDKDTAPKKKKQRSPSYPAVAIDDAIEKAKLIYRQEKKNETTPEIIYGHFGISAKSSAAMVTLAALKYYGLLEDRTADGRRLLALTPLALRIIIDTDETSPDRIAAIKQAALTPKLYANLWRQYGKELPSDQSLRTRLILDVGFNESVVGTAIAKYKRTIEFAKLDTGDTAPEIIEDEESETISETNAVPSESVPRPRTTNPQNPHAQRPGPPPQRRIGEVVRAAMIQEIVLPMARINLSFPISEESYDRMLEMLRIMKPEYMKKHGEKESDEKEIFGDLK